MGEPARTRALSAPGTAEASRNHLVRSAERNRKRHRTRGDPIFVPRTGGVPSVRQLERSAYRPPGSSGGPYPGLHRALGEGRRGRRGHGSSPCCRVPGQRRQSWCRQSRPPPTAHRPAASSQQPARNDSTSQWLTTGRHHLKAAEPQRRMDVPHAPSPGHSPGRGTASSGASRLTRPPSPTRAHVPRTRASGTGSYSLCDDDRTRLSEDRIGPGRDTTG